VKTKQFCQFLLLLLGACSIEPKPGPPVDMTPIPPRFDAGEACYPCKPEQPDTCLNQIGHCIAVSGQWCCVRPWPYNCRWHGCIIGDPSTCMGGTCEQTSDGACCNYPR
jgi:hypothetical protein